MSFANPLKAAPLFALGVAAIVGGIQFMPAPWAKWQATRAYSALIDAPTQAQQQAQLQMMQARQLAQQAQTGGPRPAFVPPPDLPPTREQLTPDAQAQLQAAIALNPGDPELASMQSNLELDQADAATDPAQADAARARAADDARQTLRVHPADPYAWYQLALALDKPDRLDPGSLAAFRMSLLVGRGEGQLIFNRLTYCALHWDNMADSDQSDCRDQASLLNASEQFSDAWIGFEAGLPDEFKSVLDNKILANNVVIGAPPPVATPMTPKGTEAGAASALPPAQ